VLVAGEGGTWELTPAVPGTFTEPGLVMYRFSAALFYANAGYFSEEIRAIVGPAPTPVRWLVVDAEAITNIDYTAARVVRQLLRDLSASGVTVAFARVAFFLRADLDRHHLTDVIGKENLFARIHDALAAYAKLQKSSSQPGPAR
jgi:MFS superfamily sulfate permease-like transporter